MNTTKICTFFLLFASSVVSPAAERHTEATGPVLLAVADPVVTPLHVNAAAIDARSGSSGVAESLPDLPALTASSAIFHAAVAANRPAPKPEPFRSNLPDSPGVSLLESSPLAGVARRVGSQRFNTEDGSSVNAFAICYRLTSRSSVQVIPGDPAPVKMAVTTMANNMGVTVGMVMRLAKQR